MAEHQYLNGGNSEVQDKQATAYLFASSGTTGIAATGVIEGLVVRQTATASGSVLIDAGACLNQASLGQGADLLIDPSQKTLDIFTNDPMGGLPRNDIIAFDSITTAIIMIKGTGNATPDDPTVPDTSVALGRLRHAASATTIPTAKIDDLRTFTTLRDTRPRVGASVNMTDSWATQAIRTHTGTWSLGEDSGGFVGALTGNTTPITIPAGKGGLYAVSLGLTNSATMTAASFVQLTIGGTLLAGSQSVYRGQMSSSAATAAGGLALTLQLAAGCTLTIITSLTSSAYGVGATMSCYRIGD